MNANELATKVVEEYFIVDPAGKYPRLVRLIRDAIDAAVAEAVVTERGKKLHALNLLANLGAHQPGCHEVCICGLSNTIERLSK